MATYGEQMHQWEHEHDQSDWKRRLSQALDTKNMPICEELVEEGIYSGYEFPDITNPIISKLITKYQQKKRK